MPGYLSHVHQHGVLCILTQTLMVCKHVIVDKGLPGNHSPNIKAIPILSKEEVANQR